MIVQTLCFFFSSIFFFFKVFFFFKFFFLHFFFPPSFFLYPIWLMSQRNLKYSIVYILNTNLGFLFNVSFFLFSNKNVFFFLLLYVKERKMLKENRICVVVLICREIVYCKAPILFSKQIWIKLQALRIKWQKLVANVGT